ncbi:MAG: hypothetical protein IJ708_10410 [Clostridia bacterium]|nr:hypothetical protein [Clostridia bacterium]
MKPHVPTGLFIPSNLEDEETMTYEDFLDMLKEKANEELGFELDKMTFYPKGYTSMDPQTREWINDCNRRFSGDKSGTLSDGILMEDFLSMETPLGGISAEHRIATAKMYEDALAHGFDHAFRNISELQKNLQAADVKQEQLYQRNSGNYEKIRPHLIIRPLNFQLHQQELKGCVYRAVGDFVLCLYHLISDENQMLITSKIKREEIREWGMENREAKIIDDAIENTARIYPACVYDSRKGKEADFLSGEFTEKDITIMGQLLLSTFKTTNGAAAIFYPGVMQKMRKIIGGDFQVVFMNINDVMIFRKGNKMANYFAQSAKTSGKLGEMLSEKVYMCDGESLCLNGKTA